MSTSAQENLANMSAQEQLGVFLVSREGDNIAPYLTWDSYNSFVIVCENADVARRTHPGSNELDWWTRPGFHDDSSWMKPEDVAKLEVTFLGVAHPNVEKGIHCASFNAG